MDDRTRTRLGGVYRAFKGVPVLRTSNKTAEMIKYASNSLLATLISFSNEIGNLCSDLGGVDSVDVMQRSPPEPVPDAATRLTAGCGRRSPPSWPPAAASEEAACPRT